MGPSRRIRLATTVLAGTLAVGGVAAWGMGGSGRRSSGTAPTTARASIPGRVPATTQPAAGDPVFQVDRTSLSVAGHTDNGAPVVVPTSVWYPSGAAGTRFPLVVFSPGYQIDPAVYGPLVTAWAAAGYVVAEPTYPDTAPGSPRIEYDMVNHPAELGQVIATVLAPGTELAAMIDPSEIAVAGQSDGGDVSLAAAGSSCCRLARIRAAIILSGAEASLFGGTYYSSGNPPLLAVQGDQDTINPPGCSEQLYDGAAPPRYYLDLPGATHLSAYAAAGPQFDAVRSVTLEFLACYLKGMTSRLSLLEAAGTVPGVSRLVSSAPVAVTGSCPGAPGGA